MSQLYKFLGMALITLCMFLDWLYVLTFEKLLVAIGPKQGCAISKKNYELMVIHVIHLTSIK